MAHMATRQKLRVGRPLDGHTNVAPTVTITAFDATPAVGVPNTTFTATAIDPEQGDISASIVWTTDGGSPSPLVIGTGANPTLTFPDAGGQTVTVTSTDGYGASDTDTQAVTVSS